MSKINSNRVVKKLCKVSPDPVVVAPGESPTVKVTNLSKNRHRFEVIMMSMRYVFQDGQNFRFSSTIEKSCDAGESFFLKLLPNQRNIDDLERQNLRFFRQYEEGVILIDQTELLDLKMDKVATEEEEKKTEVSEYAEPGDQNEDHLKRDLSVSLIEKKTEFSENHRKKLQEDARAARLKKIREREWRMEHLSDETFEEELAGPKSEPKSLKVKDAKEPKSHKPGTKDAKDPVSPKGPKVKDAREVKSPKPGTKDPKNPQSPKGPKGPKPETKDVKDRQSPKDPKGKDVKEPKSPKPDIKDPKDPQSPKDTKVKEVKVTKSPKPDTKDTKDPQSPKEPKVEDAKETKSPKPETKPKDPKSPAKSRESAGMESRNMLSRQMNRVTKSDMLRQQADQLTDSQALESLKSEGGTTSQSGKMPSTMASDLGSISVPVAAELGKEKGHTEVLIVMKSESPSYKNMKTMIQNKLHELDKEIDKKKENSDIKRRERNKEFLTQQEKKKNEALEKQKLQTALPVGVPKPDKKKKCTIL